MITKFINVDVEKPDENIIDVYLEVNFLNQPEEMIDPSVCLTFEGGKFKGCTLLVQGYNSDYKVDEVEQFQALHYLANLQDNQLHEILFK